MTEMASTRVAFGEALRDLARSGYDVVAVTADTSKSMRVDLLAREFPERWIDVGVAEQNMMMIAAGLAATGKIAFASSYSVFTSMRCCEQLRTFIAYPFLNVKVVAGLGGLTAGIEGVTHVALEDLGIIRCIPNMTILNPSDATTPRLSVKAAADWSGPVYIRLGRDASPVIFDDSYQFQIGKSVMHRKGDDIALIASGLILFEALNASDLLAKEGIGVSLLECIP
jgi:transketolase